MKTTTHRRRRLTSLRLLPVALALSALPTALSVPAPDLKGATLCLTPLTTVWVDVEGDLALGLTRLNDQLYAEIKALLRAGGVKDREEKDCHRSNAALTFAHRVRPVQGSPAAETQVATYVEDKTKLGSGSWLGGELRWSAVEYGKVSPTEAEVGAELLRDTRASLAQLVNDWKAVNR